MYLMTVNALLDAASKAPKLVADKVAMQNVPLAVPKMPTKAGRRP